jgi:hypothetical protein
MIQFINYKMFNNLMTQTTSIFVTKKTVHQTHLIIYGKFRTLELKDCKDYE